MKKLKQILIITGTLLMCLSMAACGGNASISDNPADVTTTVAESLVEQEFENVDGILVYTNNELGFKTNLPPLLGDKYGVETSERDAYGEKITTVTISYTGEEYTVNVLSFEEMSKEVWDKVQAEGGPLGMVLGESESGRVVIWNTPQSNPFAEGTADFDLFQKLPKELSVVKDNFSFIK